MPETARATAIRNALEATLQPDHVEIVDDSALHEGHPGAQGGGGYFRVLVVAQCFEGRSRLEAQRLVYEALGDLMREEIHALQMRTLTPEAWHRLRSS